MPAEPHDWYVVGVPSNHGSSDGWHPNSAFEEERSAVRELAAKTDGHELPDLILMDGQYLFVWSGFFAGTHGTSIWVHRSLMER